MPNLDRRKLLGAGIAFAVPFGGLTLFSGCQQSTDNTKSDNSNNVGETDKSVENPKQDKKEETMQIQYLEIVTPEAEALCKQYSAVHGITFSEPIESYGNARTAKLNGGGVVGIRGPLRETETPVVRPYTLVENIEEAVSAAADAGAEIAIPKMELPGHGTIAVVIQGGIECGFWQLSK